MPASAAMSARVRRCQPSRAASLNAASTMRAAGSAFLAMTRIYEPGRADASEGSGDGDNRAAGQPLELGRRNAEDGVRMASRRPQRIVVGEIGIDEDADPRRMPDRSDPADRIAGTVADEIGVGLAELLAGRGREPGLVDPVDAAGDDQHGTYAGGAEDEGFGDLRDRASDRRSSLGRAARRRRHHRHGAIRAGFTE